MAEQLQKSIPRTEIAGRSQLIPYSIPIAVKGERPDPTIAWPLRNIFEQTPSLPVGSVETYLRARFDGPYPVMGQILPHRESWASLQLLRDVGYPGYTAFPFSMKEVVDSRFLFNLDYQEALFCRWADQRFGHSVSDLNLFRKKYLVEQRFERFSMVLKSIADPGNNEPLYYSLNNKELDLISVFIRRLNGENVPWNRAKNLKINCNAYDVLTEMDLADDLAGAIKASVYAGVNWWWNEDNIWDFDSTISIMRTNMGNELRIDDTGELQALIDSKNGQKCHALYVADDSGEILFDLNVAQILLKKYPNVSLNMWANQKYILPNTTISDIEFILKDPYFGFLNSQTGKRFNLLGEYSHLETIDMRFASDDLLKEMIGSDLLLLKGASVFENVPVLGRDRFYMFTVYPQTLMDMTGLERGSGVFAHLRPGEIGFGKMQPDGKPERTLRSIKNTTP